MKWIVGGLLLAVVAAIVSGRVPIVYVVYCFSALFVFMALALFFAFARNKHYGLLLLGITYMVAAVLAMVMGEWWPLLSGFIIVWVLRAAGVEPKPEDLPDAKVLNATSEGEKKN